MLSWGEFAKREPEMVAFGEKRLECRVCYLATIGLDSYPRVHPFTPFVGSGHLFAFMEPTSQKGKDFERNRRYAIHSLVADMNGSNGELQVKGDAILVTDPSLRNVAIASCPFTPAERYILFEFFIKGRLTNDYKDGKANVKRWKLTA